MDDVVIVGAGPAGALAAALLARAGARVRVFERERFPRPKLCGDTLNPGACGVLAAHVPAETLFERASMIDGMLLTGPGGVAVRGCYGSGIAGRTIARADFDQWLIGEAVRAGAQVEEGARVDDPILDGVGGRVTGVRVRKGTRYASTHRTRLVIAADGRRSRLAFALKLARHPPRPRRWAIGGYFEDVDGLSSVGEMHIRRGHYIGVAPLPGGLANACLVTPYAGPPNCWRDAAQQLISTLERDPQLRSRFARARLVERPSVLGPMAVDVAAAGAPGLLLAGDAAGFIDPMTGDGLRFALAGAVLTARVAVDLLAGRLDPTAAVERLAVDRSAAFASKWRFNRALRRLVASSPSLMGATALARIIPGLFAAMIRYAGDCEM